MKAFWHTLFSGHAVTPSQPNYLRRWYCIPRNRWFNIYLHRFGASDNQSYGLHDHRWSYVSILLKGAYQERIPAADVGRADFESGACTPACQMQAYGQPLPPAVLLPVRTPGSIAYRPATQLHAVELRTPTAWTLILTGPAKRMWGFQTSWGWKPAHEVLPHLDGPEDAS